MCGFLRDEIVAQCSASIVPRFSGSFYTGAEGAHHNPHGRRPCQTFEPFAPFEPSRPPGRVHAGTKGGTLLCCLCKIGHLRWPPPCPLRGTSPQAGAEQPVLSVEQLTQEMPCEALLCPRLRGKGGADRHQRGRRRQAAFILAPKAPTTTLTVEGRVKPLNHLHPLNPHARQGVSMQAPKGGASPPCCFY